MRIRRERLMSRNDSNDSVDRRLKADHDDFADLYGFLTNNNIEHMIITNPNFDTNYICENFVKVIYDK
jgi:hypothetical protein